VLLIKINEEISHGQWILVHIEVQSQYEVVTLELLKLAVTVNSLILLTISQFLTRKNPKKPCG
jgi:hypothetical protein